MKAPTLLLLALLSGSALAADGKTYELVIKDHRFTPAELTVPAGQKLKLTVRNEDATPEEFESHDLRREKIIPGHSQTVIAIGPLKAGEYRFFGEFHEDSAQGKLIVR